HRECVIGTAPWMPSDVLITLGWTPTSDNACSIRRSKLVVTITFTYPLETCRKSVTRKRFSMQWALKPRMFTWEANAKSPPFWRTWDAENQIGCALPPGIWPKPWKAIGRDT